MLTDQMLELYWLGYLLTGERERSVQAVIETLEVPDAANPFFESWMIKWSRKIFIAKVLGFVTAKTNASELRNRLRRLQAEVGRSRIRGIDKAAGKAELERALLAIETFPRCALLLSVFERLPIGDVAILLNSDRESVKTATAIGLIELARNLAADKKSHATRPLQAASFSAMQGCLKGLTMLKRLHVQIEKLAGLWCRVQHHSVRWPVHGEYACATCSRRYPVPWAERSQQLATIRNQITSRDHRSVTIWAPPSHDSRRRQPVF
jgi:hypothetical protein